MNAQIRKIFVVVLIMFAMLGLAITNTQFISAPSLNADPRNVRTTRHAAEVDRGPIIVDKTAIASSELEDGSKRYTRSYTDGPLYASVTGYFSSVGSASTGIEAAEEDVLDGQSQTLLGQRLRNLLIQSALRAVVIRKSVGSDAIRLSCFLAAASKISRFFPF